MHINRVIKFRESVHSRFQSGNPCARQSSAVVFSISYNTNGGEQSEFPLAGSNAVGVHVP